MSNLKELVSKDVKEASEVKVGFFSKILTLIKNLFSRSKKPVTKSELVGTTVTHLKHWKEAISKDSTKKGSEKCSDKAEVVTKKPLKRKIKSKKGKK